MEERFGASYARSLAADYRLPVLGATVDEALARGDEAKDVWRAVVAEFEMPSHLRYAAPDAAPTARATRGRASSRIEHLFASLCA